MHKQVNFTLVCIILFLLNGLSSVDAQNNSLRIPIAVDNAVDLTLLAVLEAEDERWWAANIAFSPDGTTLAFLNEGGVVYLWDTTTFEQIDEFEIDQYSPWNTLSFTPDGEGLVTPFQIRNLDTEDVIYEAYNIFATWDGIIGICNPSNGISLDPVEFVDYETDTEIATLDDMCVNLSFKTAFNPDGTRFALGRGGTREVGWFGYLDVYDFPSQTYVYSTEFETDFVSDIAYSPDGLTLAYSLIDTNPRIHLLDAETFQEQYTLGNQAAPIFNFAYSPDGSMIASIGYEGIDLWNLNVYGRLLRVQHDDEGYQVVEFSPDGTLLAAGTHEGKVYVWGIPADH